MRSGETTKEKDMSNDKQALYPERRREVVSGFIRAAWWLFNGVLAYYVLGLEQFI